MTRIWLLVILVNGEVGLINKEEFHSRRDCREVQESIERYVTSRYSMDEGVDISYECRMVLKGE